MRLCVSTERYFKKGLVCLSCVVNEFNRYRIVILFKFN